jgi:hypothetical protein
LVVLFVALLCKHIYFLEIDASVLNYQNYWSKFLWIPNFYRQQ